MRLNITSKNLQVTDWLRAYIVKKTKKFSKYLDDATEIRVELTSENAKSAKQRQVVQVTCANNGTLIRSQERGPDMTAAIDAVVDKFDRQIKRDKDKRVSRKRRAKTDRGAARVEPSEDQVGTAILRVKRFRTSPMTPHEAIEQMENLGHTFFGFFNHDTGELNVIYKRQDGSYGRLEYEKA